MPVNASDHIFIDYSTAFMAGIEGKEDVDLWQRIARRIPSTGEKNVYDWLDLFPEAREWLGDRHIEELGLDGFEVVNRKFETTISIDEDKFEDGQMGRFVDAFRGMGRAMSKIPNKLVFEVLNEGKTRLGHDGVPLFSASHPVGDGVDSNYDSGGAEPWVLLDVSDDLLMPVIYQPRRPPRFVSKTAPSDDEVFYKGKFVYGSDRRDGAAPGVWQKAFLSELALNDTNFDSAVAQMMDFKNANDETLDVTPTLLLTTPANRSAARDLIEVERLAGGASNPNFQFVGVLITSLLNVA